jgi:putative membrane protein
MDMKSIVLAVCCVALCSFPALGQTKHGKDAAKAAPMTDQEFVDFAGQTDMTEAHLGQMAADQAAGQGVKDYAQMLVTDHTNDYNQLTAVAGKANLNVPKGMDAAHDKMVMPFHSLKGAAFDHKFIQEMIAGHTKAIAVYTKEASDAQNADLKAYANQALPTLQKHLDGAKDLAKAKPAGKNKM